MSQAETLEHAGHGDDEFPRPFGQYLLLENFARGGMGEVYLAKIGGIAGLERYCVLKKLRAELTRDREYVTRFIDEARVVVTLNHANICHVFDVGRVGEEYYLAMEYISGRDVRTTQDRCRTREKAIPPQTALHLVCETLEALDYAHHRNHPLTGEPLNLVHRDVSPQNVLVSYEGEVKLIDFGLAASRLKVERTQPNVVMGKMAYMAPEQARGDPIDARADLFACGVLAYELLAGERFYEGMTANDIWQVAGKGGFVPRRWNAIDPDLAKHLAKALHPDPKKRFATCGDLREALASHMHWRFPGTGVRGLRDVMNDLFADEVRKERELLARFGKVTVAGFRTSFDESKSQSVSLARADETGSNGAKRASSPSSQASGTNLVRNEQSASQPMPSPDVGGLPSRSDVHKEATRLTGAIEQDPTQVVRSISASNGKPLPAPTQIVQRDARTVENRDDTERKKKRGSTDEEPSAAATQRGAAVTSSSSDAPPTEEGAAVLPERTMRVRVKRSLDDQTMLGDMPPVAVPSSGGLKLLLGAGALIAVGAVVLFFVVPATPDTTTPPPSDTVATDPPKSALAVPTPVQSPPAEPSEALAVKTSTPETAPPAVGGPPPDDVKAEVKPDVKGDAKAEAEAERRAKAEKLDAKAEKAAERERKRKERERLEKERAAMASAPTEAAPPPTPKKTEKSEAKLGMTKTERAREATRVCPKCISELKLFGTGVDLAEHADALEKCAAAMCKK